MRILRLLARHAARHAAMILVAVFVLLVMTATTACRRGPVLDMRGAAADTRVSAVALSSGVAGAWTSAETTCSRSGRLGAKVCIAR
jgi:hypothetical protein